MPRSQMELDGDSYPLGKMKVKGKGNISLKSVSISGDITGLVLSSTIRQEYRNETDNDLEIIYTFPLGFNTALLGMNASISGKKLTGKVVEKLEAEASYEKAINDGDSAIMVQKSSFGLYTANLGNIKPGETVNVELHCAKLLGIEQGRIRIAIPTVIAQRYGNPHCEGGLAPHESDRVDDKAHYPFHLELALHGDISQKEICCPTHAVLTEELEGAKRVVLDKNASLDRDFVLLINGLEQYSNSVCVQENDLYMVAANFVPEMPQEKISPIGLKILVDCSGSMNGESIRQAQKGLLTVISQLRPEDYISYSRFGSHVTHMTEQLLACDELVLQEVSALIDATNADMGGTDMLAALQSTFDIENGANNLAPAVLLITDGAVWDIRNILTRARASGHRIFTIGVGSAPAEDLLADMAIKTGGAYEFVTPNESMAEAIVRMFQRMRGAIASNIHFDWGTNPIWQSQIPRFIYSGETIHAFALFNSRPETLPALNWTFKNRQYSSCAKGLESSNNKDLFRVGMLRQLNESQSKKQKLELALQHQLVSDLTSLILIYERLEGEKIKGLPTVQQVPQMPAYGHGGAFNQISSNFCGSFYTAQDSSNMEIIARIFEEGKKFVDIATLNARIEDLQTFVRWWKLEIYQISSPQEFIKAVHEQDSFGELVAFILKVSAHLGIAEEAVWSVFIPWAIQKADLGAITDRHTKRLLNRFQSADQEGILKKNFDRWHSHAIGQIFLDSKKWLMVKQQVNWQADFVFASLPYIFNLDVNT